MNTAKQGGGGSAVDAISLLRADHQKVRQLFTEFEAIKDDQEQVDLKAELVEQLCFELTIHTLVEEELFYPAVRAEIGDELVDEAEAEHAGAKDLISQLEQMEASDAQYDATVLVLNERVEQHITQEESDMFPKAKKAGLDLEQLGEQIAQRKEKIEADFDGAARPQRGSGSQQSPSANP
ncbi:MAG: hemerythrin domain-containing protein [Pseudomonadota bacterium]